MDVPHDNVDQDQYSQWEAAPIGRKEERAYSYESVFYEGARELELGQKHEEEDDVDGDGDEMDKLGSGDT